MTKPVSKKTTKKDFRCGMVSIVGRPNVGKSTLLNKIVDEKVAIVSKVPQTTRNQVRGIYNDERGQIIFIDTPGLVLGKDKLDRMLQKACTGSFADADCIIHLVDSHEHVGEEERKLAARLKTVHVPIILGLNKVDVGDKHIPDYIALWEEYKGQPISEMKNFVLLPLSGRKGTNIEKLVDIIFEFLPVAPPLYPTDCVTDIPQRLAVSDIIREKLFMVLEEELPHSIAVVIESMKPKKYKTMHIQATILVERDSQKEIVIGKNGQVLKRTGTLARQELENLLETKVFLETFVKTRKNWRDDERFLQELGYDL